MASLFSPQIDPLTGPELKISQVYGDGASPATELSRTRCLQDWSGALKPQLKPPGTNDLPLASCKSRKIAWVPVGSKPAFVAEQVTVPNYFQGSCEQGICLYGPARRTSITASAPRMVLVLFMEILPVEVTRRS